MKSKMVTTVIALIAVLTGRMAGGQTLTQNEAWKTVETSVLGGNVDGITVYVSKKILPGGSTIKTMVADEVSPQAASWFFFIDDAPFASWSHPCRYVYVDAATGANTVQHKVMPPQLNDMEALVTQQVHVSGPLFNFPRTRSGIALRSDNSYAVIINGGGNPEWNWNRYWNHCAAVYSILVNTYRFPKDHIYVLMSDGTNPAADMRFINGGYTSSPLDLDGDGSADVQYAATKQNISTVFNILSRKLTSADNLFIYTTDHGYQIDGTHVGMCLWNENITDVEFAREIDKVNARSINICMMQCHSGGFMDDLRRNNRIITTSCTQDQGATARPPDFAYSEFAYHWISAVAGKTPYGVRVYADANGDGVVSMREAFEYAKRMDQWKKTETPQYSSTPSSLGTRLSLRGPIHFISGPSTICAEGRYTVGGLLDGETVQWQVSKGLRIVSGQDSASVLVAADALFESGNITAVVRANGANPTRMVQKVTTEKESGYIQGPYDPQAHTVITGRIDSRKPYCFMALDIPRYLPEQDIYWEVHSPDGFPYKYSGYKPTISFPGGGRYTLKMRWRGRCGVSNFATREYNVHGLPDSNPIRIESANPAAGSVTISFIEEADQEPQGSSEASLDVHGRSYIVQLWGALGIVKQIATPMLSSYRLDLSGIPAGVYTLVVIRNGKNYSRHLVVQ